MNSNCNIFHCDQCGACCKQLRLFGPRYKWLDNGNGHCKYFDNKTNLCTVYALRPLICRVVEGYAHYFYNIEFKKYIDLSKKSCDFLKKKIANK